MKLAATLIGAIRNDLQAELGRIERAVIAGTKEAGDGLKRELRAQVTGAGLGVRLARTWRSRSYPNAGYDAASMVWSKAPRIIRAFDQGAVIKSQDGFWLAIPTANAPKRGTNGQRINPGNFPEGRFGRLRFVYRRRGPSLLVVDGVRVSARSGRVGRRAKGGAFTKSGGMKQGIATVVMFLLVPQVKMPRQLDVQKAVQPWEAQLPGLIDQYMGST